MNFKVLIGTTAADVLCPSVLRRCAAGGGGGGEGGRGVGGEGGGGGGGGGEV